MAFVPVPKGALVTVVYTLHGEQVTSNIWYAGTNDWAEGDLLDLAEAVWGMFELYFPEETTSQAAVIRVEARAMHTQFGPNVLWEPAVPIVGTDGSAAMPNQVCVVTTFITGLVGRSYRGRVYNPGLTEGGVSGNQVVQVYRTARDVQWTALVNLISVNVEYMAVCSRIEGGVPRAAGILTRINNVNTNMRVDTQRRRLPA